MADLAERIAKAIRPHRVQRRRTKGWRMPADTVYVGRPSPFGNPFRIVRAAAARGGPLDMWGIVRRDGRLLIRWDTYPLAAQDTLELFCRYLREHPELRERVRRDLAGRNLACWCPLVYENGNPVPCHADVLLEIANQPATEEAERRA